MQHWFQNGVLSEISIKHETTYNTPGLVCDYRTFWHWTIWHRAQFDTGEFDTLLLPNGQFDTAENLTPQTIWQRGQIVRSVKLSGVKLSWCQIVPKPWFAGYSLRKDGHLMAYFHLRTDNISKEQIWLGVKNGGRSQSAARGICCSPKYLNIHPQPQNWST